MADFILELYSEEIPAGMQARAAEHLEKALIDNLRASGAEALGVSSFVAPQRLAVLIDDLPIETEEVRSEKKGPRVDAPEQAIQGFLRANGLSDVTALQIKQDPKGDVYVLEIYQGAERVSDILARIIPEIISEFPWPKSMRWGAGKLRWVRPLRNILCRFNGEVVSFEVDGLVSNGKTYGHRFLAPDEIDVMRKDDYIGALEKAFVLVDPAIRGSMIAEGAVSLARDQACSLVEDIALVQETTGLVEWPVPLLGRIDRAFMDVPDELLRSVMRTHQKYFSVIDDKSGKLAPYFITISNMSTEDSGAAIIAGNERVLRARLADGQFFWQQDLKISLDARLPALDNITFHAKLGSVGQKARRISALAGHLAAKIGADAAHAARAGLLCKADLVSGVVYEFPELQGIMGGYYAVHDGEAESVGAAITQHYAPQGPRDAIPASQNGQIVALADKLDTLTGFWLIDEKPTGSKDPYALRRAALGVIRILLETRTSLNLLSVLTEALGQHNENSHPQKSTSALVAIAEDLLSFIIDRLQVYLRDAGVRHDIVLASLLAGADDVVEIVGRGQALTEFVLTEDGENLLAAYNRADGILRQSDLDNFDALGIDDKRLVDPAEQALYAALRDLDAHEDFMTPEALRVFLSRLAKLRAPVDKFFEDVLVNVDDKALKLNRFALLHGLVTHMGKAGDFSKIVR